MKDNNYKFMLLTGKYLPDEDIKDKVNYMFFYQYNGKGQIIYSENSVGGWCKKEYNSEGKLIRSEVYYGDIKR